ARDGAPDPPAPGTSIRFQADDPPGGQRIAAALTQRRREQHDARPARRTHRSARWRLEAGLARETGWRENDRDQPVGERDEHSSFPLPAPRLRTSRERTLAADFDPFRVSPETLEGVELAR